MEIEAKPHYRKIGYKERDLELASSEKNALSVIEHNEKKKLSIVETIKSIIMKWLKI